MSTTGAATGLAAVAAASAEAASHPALADVTTTTRATVDDDELEDSTANKKRRSQEEITLVARRSPAAARTTTTAASRRLVVVVVVVAALTAALVAAAGAVVAAEETPKASAPELQLERSSLLFWRQLQEEDADNSACVTEYANFTDCVGANGNDNTEARVVGGCDNCVVSYWNVTTTTEDADASPSAEYCEQLQRGTCEGWHSCKNECPRKCRNELVTLIDCITQCSLTPLNQCPERNQTVTGGSGSVAPTSPVPAPVPAPSTNSPALLLSTPPPTYLVVPQPEPAQPVAPTAPLLDVCERQKSELNSCWLQQPDSTTEEKNECARCHLLRLSGFNSSTLCVEYQPKVCEAVQQCSCGDCTFYQVQLTECLTACTFDCSDTGGGVSGPTFSPVALPAVPTSPTPMPTRFPTRSPILRAEIGPTRAPSADTVPSTPTPSASNTTTEEPRCPDQQAVLNECLGYNDTTNISPCELCVVTSSWPDNRQVCSDIDNATCRGLDLCQEECQNCQQEFLEYATCETSCSFPCSMDNSSTTVPPRNTSICTEEYAAFDTCVDPVMLGYECEKCVTSYWTIPTDNATEATLCGDLNNDTCLGLQLCSGVCNGCHTELLHVVSCVSNCDLTGTCSSNATFVPPTPSVAPTLASPPPVSSSPSATAVPTLLGDCADKDRAIVQCFANNNRTAAPCGGCVADLSPGPCPFNSSGGNLCDLFEEQCGELCEPCGSQIQEAVDCYAALDDCGATQLVCSSTNGTNSSSGPTAAASAVPTVAPSPIPPVVAVESCPDEKDEVDRCLSEQLDSSAKDTCESCVETVYGNLMKDLGNTNSSPSTTTAAEACAKVNDAVCRALSQSCVCGACTSTYQSYVDCRVDQQPVVQDGECMFTCNRTSINSGNSTVRSTSGGCGPSFPKGFVAALTTSLATLCGMIWIL